MHKAMDRFHENDCGGLVYMTSAVLPVKHAFTTRFGGVSTGILESLNLGENRGDDEACVRENYRRLCAALDVPVDSLVFSRQVHGAEVRAVTEADRHALFSPVPYEADALVTNQTGLTLTIFTADCVPVLLCDDAERVIAAVHCGWRSSVADILAGTLKAMSSLGAKAENIRAAIGPAIGACCFEVGPEVPEALRLYLGAEAENYIRPEPGVEGKFLVDLQGANRARLLQLGLRPENVDVSDECTVCKSDKYWSHRATKGQRGSQASLITL